MSTTSGVETVVVVVVVVVVVPCSAAVDDATRGWSAGEGMDDKEWSESQRSLLLCSSPFISR